MTSSISSVKNIKLAYIIKAFYSMWFFLGIWVLYYLRYTDYAGIGLIEAVMMISSTLTEIPTGAVADLLGKKKTLLIAFFIMTTGQALVGFAPNFSVVYIAIIYLTFGYSFYSGTFDALLFDSLKEKRQEELFDKVIANTQTIQMIGFALSSVIGGYLYRYNPSLPFFAMSGSLLIAFLLSFLLKEPKIDSEKFSWNNYKKQTKMGFKELFKTSRIQKQSIFLMMIGVFIVVNTELLDNVQMVAYGLDEIQLGILAAAIYLVSAFAAQLTPFLNKFIGVKNNFILMSVFIGITLIISPILGIITGSIMLILRTSVSTISDNSANVIINRNTQSKYRATTLSSYNLIRNIPYIIFAFMIGSLMDNYSPHWVAFGFGILMFMTFMMFGGVLLKRAKKTT